MKKDTKILFISHDALRTGAPILLLNLLKALKEDGFNQIEVLLKHGGVLSDEFKKIYPTKIIFQERSLKKGCKFLIDFSFRRKNDWFDFISYVKKFDFVISNTITNGDLHFMLKDHPRVFTYVHELKEAINFFTNKDYLSNVLSHTYLFLVPCDCVKNNLIMSYDLDSDKILELPYYIPDHFDFEKKTRNEVRNSLGVLDGEVLVLGLGTGDWRKGPDLFLQTLNILSETMPSIKGIWVGMDKDGLDFRRFKHDLANTRVYDKLIVLDSVDNPLPILAASDIFFLSSREDPYPLAMIESAMMQLPLIYFEGTGGASDFVDSSMGISVPYYRVDIAAESIKNLIKSSSNRIEFGKKSRDKYLMIHVKENILAKFYLIFEHL